MAMELVNVEKALCDISREEIKEMVAQFETLKVIPGDKASYKMVNDAKNKFVHLRCDIDKKRKSLNESAQAEIKKRNSAANELVALFAPAEDHCTKEVKTEDDRIAKIETERKERIQARIAFITQTAAVGYNDSSEVIQDKINAITEFVIDDTLEEFGLEAQNTKEASLAGLNAAMTRRVQFEKEEADRAAERVRLEQVAKEQKEIDAQHDWFYKNVRGEDGFIPSSESLKEGIAKLETMLINCEEYLKSVITRQLKDAKYVLTEVETSERLKEAQKAIDAENARLKAEADKIEQAKRDEAAMARKEKLQTRKEQLDPDPDGKFPTEEDLLEKSEDDFIKFADDWNLTVSQIKADREAAIKAQAEKDLLAKIEREAREKAEREHIEEMEAARVAALAPDRDKIKSFARTISQLISAPPEIKDKDLKIAMDARLTAISGQVTQLLEIAGA